MVCSIVLLKKMHYYNNSIETLSILIKGGKKMNNYNTAYDDVFRTLLVDCSELIIPVVNEVFHTNYVGDENVILYENEIFMREQDGDEEKIITDSTFLPMKNNLQL